MPKPPKKGSGEPENTFRLHYFPEIPVDFATQNPAQVKGERSLDSIDFEKTHETLTELSNEFAEENKNHSTGSNRDIEEIEAQAYLRGFNKGEKAGFKTGQQKIASLMDTLQTVVAELETLRKKIFIDSESEIVELALAIARRIVCHEVKLNKNTVIDVTREALKRVEEHEKIKIKLKPEDLECLAYADANPIGNNENVTFEAEDTISSGGCVVETDAGAFDARIEKQLQAVEEALRAAYKRVAQKH